VSIATANLPNEIINASFDNLDDTVLHWKHYIDPAYVTYWSELTSDTKMSLYSMAVKLYEHDALFLEFSYDQ
jgi:hypothetical protein